MRILHPFNVILGALLSLALLLAQAPVAFAQNTLLYPPDTGYSGRIGVRIEFTAGEVKPPVQSVVNRRVAEG